MIKAEPGYHAKYAANEQRIKPSAKDVVAWADDGHPMVVGDKGLVRAESLPGYEGLGLDGSPMPFAFIPGNGWMVERENGERDPLVAWAMCTYGGGEGVFALPVFTEESEVWRGNGRTWTTAKLGGDPDPVRVVPEKRADRD